MLSISSADVESKILSDFGAKGSSMGRDPVANIALSNSNNYHRYSVYLLLYKYNSQILHLWRLMHSHEDILHLASACLLLWH